jgi:hypothetical protein
VIFSSCQEDYDALHLRVHRIRSGGHTLATTVAQAGEAGIDPNRLLIDLGRFDDVRKVKIET